MTQLLAIVFIPYSVDEMCMQLQLIRDTSDSSHCLAMVASSQQIHTLSRCKSTCASDLPRHQVFSSMYTEKGSMVFKLCLQTQ